MNKIIKIFGLLTILIMVCSPLTSANTTISGTDRSIGAVAQTIPDSVVDPNNNNTVANFIKSKYPNINKVEISLILGFMSKSQQQGFDIFAGYISGDPTYVNYYNSGSPYTTAVINNWFEWIDEYSKLDFIGRANYLNYNMPSDDLTSDILDNASEDEVIYIIERTQSYLTNITSVSSTLSDDLDHTSNLFTKGNIGKEGSVKVQEAITNYNRGVSIAHLAYQIEHSDDEPLSIEKILNSDLTIPEQIATLIGYRDLANNSLTRIDKTITTISSAITGVSVAGGIIFAGAMLILIFGAAAGPAYIALIPLGLVILAIGLVLIGCDCGLETAKNRLNNVKHQTQDFIDTLTPIINTLSASVLDWKKYSNLSIDNVTLSSPHKEVFVGDSVNVSFHVVNNDMNNSSISDGRYNVSVGGSDVSLDFVDGWANYLYKVNQPTTNLAIVFKENLEANDTQS
ncbi:MAG: hypothetical protein LBT66_04610, partial [Methanobrevibacter sp.]|nr:hypothetical protein [Candidatus Methanovirga meridionalis]